MPFLSGNRSAAAALVDAQTASAAKSRVNLMFLPLRVRLLDRGSTATEAARQLWWKADARLDRSSVRREERCAHSLVEHRIAAVTHREYAKRLSALGFLGPVGEDDPVDPAQL